MAAVVTAAFGIASPAAAADDNSVYRAYVSRDADFVKLGKHVRRGMRIWYRSGWKRSKPALRALARTVKACDELIPAIDAEQPSSDHGARGKSAAIASVRFLGKSAATAGKGVRAGTAGHRARAKRLLARADRQLRQAGAEEKVARREFKAAGVQIKPG